MIAVLMAFICMSLNSPIYIYIYATHRDDQVLAVSHFGKILILRVNQIIDDCSRNSMFSLHHTVKPLAIWLDLYQN